MLYYYPCLTSRYCIVGLNIVDQHPGYVLGYRDSCAWKVLISCLGHVDLSSLLLTVDICVGQPDVLRLVDACASHKYPPFPPALICIYIYIYRQHHSKLYMHLPYNLVHAKCVFCNCFCIHGGSSAKPQKVHNSRCKAACHLHRCCNSNRSNILTAMFDDLGELILDGGIVRS